MSRPELYYYPGTEVAPLIAFVQDPKSTHRKAAADSAVLYIPTVIPDIIKCGVVKCIVASLSMLHIQCNKLWLPQTKRHRHALQ